MATMIPPPIKAQMINILSPGLSTELLYSLVIISCSLMIYFGTKELYTLSNHKGIGYFRKTFLFFAIAYFSRSFIKFILEYFNTTAILNVRPDILGQITGLLTLIIFMYFSSMAIFYLLYSVMWKKWGNRSNKIYIFHALAIIIAISIVLLQSSIIYLTINIILFLIVLFTVYISHKNKKKKKKKTSHNLYIIYILLAFFWILNILDILIPEFFQLSQLFIYVASIIIFLTILYKVLKKTGSS